MSEYRLHRLVKDLIEAVGSAESPEVYVESLQQVGARNASFGRHVTKQSSIKYLLQESPNPEHFIEKYDQLKAKNTDCLEPFLQMLWMISDDKELKLFLKRKARKASKTAAQTSLGNKTTASLTTENLPEIRSRLMEEVAARDKKAKAQDGQTNAMTPMQGPPVLTDCGIWKNCQSADFSVDASSEPFRALLGPVPRISQESILIEDLLSCMAGVEGEYIVPLPLKDKYATRTFCISSSVDPSLRELVKAILPLASHYSMVVRFMEERSLSEFGQVCHALTAAVELLIRDYIVFVQQLESLSLKGGFSLQRMCYHVQTMMNNMEVLSKIASTVCKSDARGGKVLSLLHEQTASYIGSSKSQELCLYLTQMACQPYMEILEKWIYKGVIYDPYHEFLVEDNEVIQKEELPLDYSADYWEKRYMIRRDRIPLFLERMSDVILRTGKYLNVIRQCGKNVKSPHSESLMYTITERQYVEAIEKAYSFASKTLLELLLQENDLMGRLRSVKHYFLLDQGDFIVQLMDSCESELGKNIDDIVPTRLETLLEMALRMSAANMDPYKDDMRMELLPYDLIFQMFKILSIETLREKEYRLRTGKKGLTGLLSFSFGYEVKWPVSLVLNRKAIACYQMIFRHLFYCKHIERLLCRVWLKNKLAKAFSLKASQMYVAAFALRQRMLDCVQNLEYYMMVEVIEPSWVIFLNKISKVNNVDEVLSCHTDFLDSCLKDSMLTNPELLRNVYFLLDICIEFYEFIQTHDACGEPKSDSKVSETVIGRSYLKKRIVSDTDTFEEAINKLGSNFTKMLVSLLRRITTYGRHNNNEKLVNLMYRLDFNGFYNMDIKIVQENDWESFDRGDEETSG